MFGFFAVKFMTLMIEKQKIMQLQTIPISHPHIVLNLHCRIVIHPSKNYTYIYRNIHIFENVKERMLKSIISWSKMEQQIAQAKKVYQIMNCNFSIGLGLGESFKTLSKHS